MTEIYLCNVCSCHEILRRNGLGQAKNYHDTLTAHGVHSTLVLQPSKYETCGCLGQRGDPAAASSPYSDSERQSREYLVAQMAQARLRSMLRRSRRTTWHGHRDPRLPDGPQVHVPGGLRSGLAHQRSAAGTAAAECASFSESLPRHRSGNIPRIAAPERALLSAPFCSARGVYDSCRKAWGAIDS